MSLLKRLQGDNEASLREALRESCHDFSNSKNDDKHGNEIDDALSLDDSSGLDDSTLSDVLSSRPIHDAGLYFTPNASTRILHSVDRLPSEDEQSRASTVIFGEEN